PGRGHDEADVLGNVAEIHPGTDLLGVTVCKQQRAKAGAGDVGDTGQVDARRAPWLDQGQELAWDRGRGSRVELTLDNRHGDSSVLAAAHPGAHDCTQSCSAGMISTRTTRRPPCLGSLTVS